MEVLNLHVLRCENCRRTATLAVDQEGAFWVMCAACKEPIALEFVLIGHSLGLIRPDNEQVDPSNN